MVRICCLYNALLYQSFGGFSAFSVIWQKGNGTLLLRWVSLLGKREENTRNAERYYGVFGTVKFLIAAHKVVKCFEKSRVLII